MAPVSAACVMGVTKWMFYSILTDKSLMTKKVDGIKESSESSTVLEDEDGQGN